jgi:hypothetical protein
MKKRRPSLKKARMRPLQPARQSARAAAARQRQPENSVIAGGGRFVFAACAAARGF